MWNDHVSDTMIKDEETADDRMLAKDDAPYDAQVQTEEVGRRYLLR